MASRGFQYLDRDIPSALGLFTLWRGQRKRTRPGPYEGPAQVKVTLLRKARWRPAFLTTLSVPAQLLSLAQIFVLAMLLPFTVEVLDLEGCLEENM